MGITKEQHLRALILVPEARFRGGMHVQAQLLARRLHEEGHAVRLLAAAPPLGPLARVPLLRTVLGGGLFLASLLARLPAARVVLIFAASGPYFSLRVAPTILLARLMRRRVVVSYRGGGAPSYFARKWWWVRRCLALAHRVIVPSAWLAQVFSRRGFPARIVPSIVDPDAFSFREPGAEGFRILVARHDASHARLALALEAFARVRRHHPEARLAFAGRGTERLARLAERRGIEAVSSLGAVAPEDMPRVFAAHDLLLSPMACDNFPNSVLEAHAAGLPVVATRVGGVPDLVADGGSGLLVDAEDVPGMASAMVRLIEDRELARRLANAGRRMAEAHAWARWRRAWVSVLGGEARPRGAPPRRLLPAEVHQEPAVPAGTS